MPAPVLEASIRQVEGEEEVRKSAPGYLNISKKEQYEDQQASKKEKDAALQMLAKKREIIKQEEENVSQGDQASKLLRGRAQNSRAFAEKIRSL